MMTGPQCDYKDCTYHTVETYRTSLKRHQYCTTLCRDNERKRRHNEARANQEERSKLVAQMVEEHRAKRAAQA